MPSLVLSIDMLHDLADLPKHVHHKVADLTAHFDKVVFAGAKLEKPHAALDPKMRSVRVDDFWRGVVCAPDKGDTYVLLRVMAHDDAYAWAQHNMVQVNAATGAVEILNVAAAEALAADALGAESPDAADTGLFDHVSDAALLHLGISQQVLPIVRQIRDEDLLLAIAGVIPPNQADVLLRLADGATPDEVWAALAGDRAHDEAIDPGDIAAAIERDASALQFVAVKGPDDLNDILNKPLDLWRVFLHPDQRRIAYRSVYNGPVRVTGGAGTGKTVVAMHRAKALADTLPADQPILFTTFTKNLTSIIGRNLEVLGGKALRDRIVVQNVDRLALHVVRDAEGKVPKVLSDKERTTAWKRAIEETGSAFDQSFLDEEWEQVVLAQAITNRDAYLNAPRPGRGIKLDRKQRLAVWETIEAFGSHQRDTGKRTFLQLSLEAAGYLQASAVKPYAAVIVDEAQDLHPAQWRMLRAAVAEGPNDMFLVGDAFQRIYANRTTLSKVGISVVGRSYRLRINYRTTRQILNWAVALLHGVEADDLDGDSDTLVGYRSLLSGTAPAFHGFATAALEEAFLVEWVKGLVANGFTHREIAIAARTNDARDAIVKRLSTAGIAAAPIEGDIDHDAVAVSVGTMHRMKGLEFRAVAVASCARGRVPLPAAIVPANVDPKAHARSLDAERSLLFVACTRSREVLTITWSGTPSEFLVTTGAVPATTAAPVGPVDEELI